MWPFAKETPATPDTTDAIWIGNRSYPLVCDNQLYFDSLERIKQYISSWLSQEIDLEKETTFSEYSLIKVLYQTDIRNLAWESALEMFLTILRDSSISRQSVRLEDLIVRIAINIPTEVLETITGKFLYGVLYKTRRTVNETEYPQKEEWEHALMEIPWIPLLPLFQEVMDQDHSIRRIAEKAQSATIVNVNRTRVS